MMAVLPSHRLLGIAGRPLPGVTGFLSARDYCSFREIVIYHSLKESPHSSRRDFSEGRISYTFRCLNPTATGIFPQMQEQEYIMDWATSPWEI